MQAENDEDNYLDGIELKCNLNEASNENKTYILSNEQMQTLQEQSE